MKTTFTFLAALLISTALFAQDQTINGNVNLGINGDSTLGKGKQLQFRGVQSGSDEVSIFRFNRANGTDLRINIADDYGQPYDRFVVGTTYFLDKVYYPHMVILSNGKVGIGTETFGAERLGVNGAIHAKEVRVDNANWPDYVFENSYPLSTLPEIEIYVKKHKHLPGIPSVDEVNANGINLGDMNSRLLKKIEELTLFLIDQNKKMEVQQKKDEALEDRITDLEKLLGKPSN